MVREKKLSCGGLGDCLIDAVDCCGGWENAMGG